MMGEDNNRFEQCLDKLVETFQETKGVSREDAELLAEKALSFVNDSLRRTDGYFGYVDAGQTEFTVANLKPRRNG